METLETNISVWLVEDDSLYRQIILDLIDGSNGMRCTRVFSNCEEALKALRFEHAPQVMLMDIGLPGMDGTKGAKEVNIISPATQIIMLTVHEDEDKIFEAICAGASGYILKHASLLDIIRAIQDVHQGGVPFTAPIARKVLHIFKENLLPKGNYGLSEREKEILQLMAEGLSKKRMAEKLFLSPHTIDTHLRNIYTKLHVHSGTAAIAKALKERII